MEISNELYNKIVDYVEDHQPTMYWEWNNQLSKEQIIKIIQNPDDGLWDVENEIWENNLDYIWEEENIILDNIKEEFEDELIKHMPESGINEWLNDEVRPSICFDMDIKGLLKNTPDQTVLVEVHSNYDCINSWNEIDEPENYLSEVYNRVKDAVNKEDYLNEFGNTYTAELLCFVANISIENILELLKDWKESPKPAKILIPKGTMYGFFGSFHGSGSAFEAKTIEDLVLTEDEYDGWNLCLDIDQHHSMFDTYGDTSWVKDGYFKIMES